MNVEQADVVVIGGGSTGASIACHLAERGAQVRLYDKGEIGAGTTGDSPGIVRAFYHDLALAALARDCLRILRQWDEETAGGCGYRACGFTTGIAGGDPAAAARIVAATSAADHPMTMRPAGEAAAAFPDFSPSGLDFVIQEPAAGYCDPRSTARLLASRARRAGAGVFEGVGVRRILTQRGEVTGVETATDAVHCPAVVNASGVWAAQVAASVDAPLPIEVSLRGVAAVVVADEAAAPGGGYGESALGFYMRPQGPGTYLLGSLLASDSRPASPSDRGPLAAPAALAHYSDYARGRLTRFGRARVTAARWSVFDETPDGNPIVGQDPRVRGLWLAAGLCGHGFKFCPAFGEGLADLIATGRTAFDFSRFAPGRFLERITKRGQAGR